MIEEKYTTVENLRTLRPELLALHRELLQSEKEAYERTFGSVSPTAFLQLLTGDSHFAWLQPLNELVTRIDAALADKREPLTVEKAAALIAEAKALLTPDGRTDGFGGRYHQAMQRDPHVIMAHAALGKRWPAPERNLL